MFVKRVNNMNMKDISISSCLPMWICMDKSKLKYIGRKKVRSRVEPHYEYIYFYNNNYYRSCELLKCEDKKEKEKDDNEIELYSPYYNCMS
jgi:hypothetical protein